jgi:hypothetical protein
MLLSLPLPLLLLIHIHLLGYPHADEPEYDENVFNVKTRGLRDRTKTMEDLCYFLVGKIEHRPRLKSVSSPPIKDARACLELVSALSDIPMSAAIRLGSF